MRVSLQPQITNSNRVQSKHKPYTSAPLKTDSVSFTSKGDLVEEIFKLIPEINKKTLPFFEYLERYSAKGQASTTLRIMGDEYTIVEKTIEEQSFENPNKYCWSIMKNDNHTIQTFKKPFNQPLEEKEYEELTQKLREMSIPIILKKHGFGKKSITQILNNLGLEISEGKAKVLGSHYFSYGSEGLTDHKFSFKNQKTISLIESNDERHFKIAFVSPGGIERDIIPLTTPEEIEKFKQVLELK